MKELIRVMKALSDPNRVKILKLLQHRPGMCVCEIQALLEIAQPTVSKHLKALEDAGLVDHRKDGLWVLGLDGRIVGESASAAHVLAILKRAAALARAEGREVDLVFSAPLRAAAHREAEAEGLDFEAFQARLAEQMKAAGSGPAA